MWHSGQLYLYCYSDHMFFLTESRKCKTSFSAFLHAFPTKVFVNINLCINHVTLYNNELGIKIERPVAQDQI